MLLGKSRSVLLQMPKFILAMSCESVFAWLCLSVSIGFVLIHGTSFSGLLGPVFTDLPPVGFRQNTPHWRIKKINGTDQRSRGFCPLTPTEVGIFLHALGYPESTRIYIAAGEIYGGHKQMAGLVARFPHLMSKVATSSPLQDSRIYLSGTVMFDLIQCSWDLQINLNSQSWHGVATICKAIGENS